MAVNVGAAQELSTFVYPSEDELEEAFYRGEIDFIQLVTLQELIRSGIDSTELYLFDEIPNLSYFFDIGLLKISDLSAEQAEPFLDKATDAKLIKGKIIHNYSTRLEEDGDSRYRTRGEIGWQERLKAAFRLHREYSGVERFVYRRLELSPQKSPLKRIVLGNYSTRLGLGTVMGYRGKLLDFSNEISGESFLYPDYGGYNGLQLELKSGKSEGELVFSHIRDASHSLKTLAASFELGYKQMKPTAIMAVTNLRNRVTGSSITDFKYGLNLESKYKNGYNRVELSAQSGEINSFGAFITEGKHLFNQHEIGYAGWRYDDNYLDLTGGSKAASIRRSVDIEEVDFSYSDKRGGQAGGLLKTTIGLADNLELINSFIYAQRDHDNFNFEVLSAIEKKLKSNLLLRLDHVSRIKHRLESAQETEDIFRRSRIELRLINPMLYVRTFLAYQSKTDKDDYISLFASTKYKTERIGELSLWLNLGEINHNQGRIDYWYGYIENKSELIENVRTVAKFTHSYRRGESDEHISTVSVGVEVSI